MTQFEVGSISTGTLRPEDLLPVFHKAVSSIVHHRWGVEPGTPQQQVDELIDVLNSYCPPFVYFGAHALHNPCFGFWVDWEGLEEARRDGDGMTYANGEEYLVDANVIVHVNDHGNVTVMDLNRNVLWAVV